jgi:SAM-dependent methyltransferase
MHPLIRPENAKDQPRIVRGNHFGVTAISMLRRAHDARFATRYFRGDGIDVGGGWDSLSLCKELFPLIGHVFIYETEHGDAQMLANVGDATFDFLYSSHCLEHLRDPGEALHNWIRVVKPGGFLVIDVPDEDLYEQGIWPSLFNPDHKLTFTIGKAQSWVRPDPHADGGGRDRGRAAAAVGEALPSGLTQRHHDRGHPIKAPARPAAPP